MDDAQTLRTQYKVSDFVAWQKDSALELNPNFQRRPVWKPKAKSFLIDTILRGLPMPIIFLRDKRSDLRNLKAMRDVVDGQQRIRTVLSFIDVDLVRALKNFEASRDRFTIDKAHNPDLAGKGFSDLEEDYQRRILDYQFSVHVFPADTSNSEILQIFARMNSTGARANPQELRNSQYYGQFKTAAYELATEQLDRWADWKIFTPDQIARMLEVELTSDLMILMMNGVISKTPTTIDSYYDTYDDIFPERKEVSRRLHSTLDQISTMFTRDVIATSFSNQSMFYTLFAIIYGKLFELRMPVKLPVREPLKREKAKPIEAGLAEQLKQAVRSIKDKSAPQEVLKASRGAVTDLGSRRTMIGYLAGNGNDPCPQLP